MSPTARTLHECKRLGWTAGVVERRVRFNLTIDLFGCIDIVAATPLGLLGIQACAGASHANRYAKALAEPRLRAWLDAGCGFAVWSWRKAGARGKRKTWQLRAQGITSEQLTA